MRRRNDKKKGVKVVSLKEFIFESYIVILPIVLSYIIWILKQQTKARDANAEGTRALLMIKIVEYHDQYCKIGKIPSYVYQNIEILYNAYHKLGGNGMITKMKEEIDELEIRKG